MAIIKKFYFYKILYEIIKYTVIYYILYHKNYLIIP